MSTMLCPFCKSDTEVLDTRKDKQGGVRRRRECAENHHRFTTYENLYDMEPAEIQKVKRELRVLDSALRSLNRMFK